MPETNEQKAEERPRFVPPSSNAAPERKVMFHVSEFLRNRADYKMTEAEQTCVDSNHTMLQRGLIGGTVVLTVASYLLLDLTTLTKKPRRYGLFASQLALVSSLAFLGTYSLSKFGSQRLAQCLLDCPDKTTDFNKTVRAMIREHNPNHQLYFSKEKPAPVNPDV